MARIAMHDGQSEWGTPNYVSLENGDYFKASEIDELVKFIINKFAEEKLTCEKGKIVLDKTKDLIESYSQVNATNREVQELEAVATELREKSGILLKLVSSGEVSINDARKELGLPPREGCDVMITKV